MKKKFLTESEWLTCIPDILKKRASLLENEIEIRKASLQNAPPGMLRINKHGNIPQYYYRKDSLDRLGTYIPNKNRILAEELAQRDYDSKFVLKAEKELSIIKRYLRTVTNNYIESILDETNSARQKLITPVITPINKIIEEWESEEYEGGFFAPNAPEFYSQKNERVRSKTEREIANSLRYYGVPYHYEYPLTLNGIQFHPDFYCLNLRTRKTFIWEHFGMMDDIAYVRDNVEKISVYEQNGFMPGINYITTFETSKNPLSDRIIKKQIETYLL